MFGTTLCTRMSFVSFDNQAPSNTGLSEGSIVCSFCTREVWFQFIFRYMNDHLPEFPESFRSKPHCWYGINCRTFNHNSSHGTKLYHICPQTRF
jgi:hypothetical protein